MRNQVSIYTELSNKYNIPYPIIEVICNSPFRFTNSIISNLDPKPVRFSYLGKFKLKKRYEKETVEANIIDYYKKQINMMVEWLLVK